MMVDKTPDLANGGRSRQSGFKSGVAFCESSAKSLRSPHEFLAGRELPHQSTRRRREISRSGRSHALRQTPHGSSLLLELLNLLVKCLTRKDGACTFQCHDGADCGGREKRLLFGEEIERALCRACL